MNVGDIMGKSIRLCVYIALGGIFFSFNCASIAQSAKQAHPIIRKIKEPHLLSQADTKKKSPSLKETNELHGQFNLTNNYIFRGISQTKNYPSAQGGISYTVLQNGFYIGGWGSNAFFVDELNHVAYIELDPNIGISKQVTKDFYYDLSVSYYYYPSVIHSSYPEFNAYFNYKWISTHFAYSNDVYAVGKSGTYYNVGLNHLIPSNYFFNIEDVHFTAAIGYSDLPQNKGLQSYQDYSFTLSKIINSFMYTIQWTDTNGRSVDNHALKKNLVAIMVGRSF